MQDQTPNSQADREITGKPWWKTCLIVSIVAIIALFLASFVVVRFVGGTGPKTMRQLPENFPASFIVYRIGLVKNIVYYPAEEKIKPIRMIMSPVLAVAKFSDQGASFAESVDRYLGAVKKNESVTLSWENVDAPVDEVVAFYAGSMKTAGIADPQMRQTEEKDVSELQGMTNDGVKIDVLIVDQKETPKIDGITVVVEYPVTK